VASWLCGSKC